MLLTKLLADKQIVLASNSPRRKKYLTELGFNFVTAPTDIEETYPDNFVAHEITDHIAYQKAMAVKDLQENTIIIASDTIVWHDQTALGKPTDYDDAFRILKSLSGRTHDVISSICLRSLEKTVVFNALTKVEFYDLSDESIDFYIKNYQPFDKAGAYGIQEWIGLIGVARIEGSYTNIVGLPTEKLCIELFNFIS